MVASSVQLVLVILPSQVDGNAIISREDRRLHQLFVCNRVAYTLFTLQNGLTFAIDGGRHPYFRKSGGELDP